MRASVRRGEAEPDRAGARIPLRRHRACERRHPEDAVGARRRLLRQGVEEVVDVRSGRGRAGDFGRAELVAEPPVGAAGQPAGVLQQPRVRVRRADAARRRRSGRARARPRRRTPAPPCRARRTRRPGSTTPAPSVAAISSPQPITTSVSRASPVASLQPRRDRAQRRVRGTTGASRSPSTPYASHAAGDHARERGSSRPVDDAFEGSTASTPEARQATHEPGSRNADAPAATSGSWLRQPAHLRPDVARVDVAAGQRPQLRRVHARRDLVALARRRGGRTRSARGPQDAAVRARCDQPVELRAERQRGDLCGRDTPRARRTTWRPARAAIRRSPARPSPAADRRTRARA